MKPNAASSGLLYINAFSNTDKHRMLSQAYSVAQVARVRVDPSDGRGQAVNNQVVGPPEFVYKDEVEIARFQWARPYPTQLQASGTITGKTAFVVPWTEWQVGAGLTHEGVVKVMKFVDELIYQFSLL